MRILAAALLALLFILPARADMTTVTPGALAPALGVYVDALVRDRATALACAKPDSPVRDDAAWAQAKAVFVATLWANGFAVDFIKETAARLDALPPAGQADCNDATAAADLGYVERDGWGKEIDRVFSSIDITPVATPVSPQQWQAIKDAVAAELPLEKRLLECVAATLPTILPVTVHDWDDMLAKIAAKLVAAGLPRDDIVALIGGAEAKVLWQRAPAEAAAALAASCSKDEAWSQRFYNLEFLSLGGAIDKLLPPADDTAN
ncbi:MAG: hypothetical protein WDM94_00485 [Bauldia sp.]